MDSRSPQVALLSIRPEYAEAILSGDKRVEFRRTRFARRVSFVVIYATQPIGKVVGWFEVDGIDACPPEELWDKFRDCAGIGEDAFLQYYAGSETGYAIRVRTAFRLQRSKTLEHVSGTAKPPQSFAYLPKDTAQRVLAYAGIRTSDLRVSLQESTASN